MTLLFVTSLSLFLLALAFRFFVAGMRELRALLPRKRKRWDEEPS